MAGLIDASLNNNLDGGGTGAVAKAAGTTPPITASTMPQSDAGTGTGQTKPQPVNDTGLIPAGQSPLQSSVNGNFGPKPSVPDANGGFTGGMGVTGIINANAVPTSHPSYPATPPTAADTGRQVVADNAVVDPTKQSASGVSAVTGSVDQPTMTVQGQLEQLLASDSPLMQQARASAMKEANSRGLVNSSMAAQSGEEAAISSALPIAQQDASTYFQQQGQNLAAENVVAQGTQQFENQQSLADYNQQAARAAQSEAANEQLKSQEQQYQDSYKMFTEQNALQKQLTEEGFQTQRDVAGTQAGAEVSAASIGAAASEANAQLMSQTNKYLGNLDAQTRTAVQQSVNDTNLKINTAGLSANAATNFTNEFTSIMTSQMEPGDKQTALGNLSALWGGSSYLPPGMHLDPSILPPANTTTPPPGGTSNTGDPGSGG